MIQISGVLAPPVKTSNAGKMNLSTMFKTAVCKLFPVLLVLLTLGLNTGRSQPPVPAPGEATHIEKSDAQSKAQVAHNDQAVSDSIPASINKLISEIASWKKQKSTQNDPDNSPQGWWLMFSTIASSFATLAIAILGFFQFRVMQGQRTTVDRQAEYMRDGLTETKKAADAAVEAAALSKYALRADVGITAIILKDRNPEFRTWAEDMTLSRCRIEITVTNTGGTKARDFGVTSNVAIEGLGDLVAHPEELLLKHETDLYPGVTSTISLPTIRELFPDWDAVWSYAVTERNLVAHGCIAYKDIFGAAVSMQYVARILPSMYGDNTAPLIVGFDVTTKETREENEPTKPATPASQM